MTIYLVTDNAVTAVGTAGAYAGSTSLPLVTGTGSLFPNPSAGQAFYVRIGTDEHNEVATCTARDGDMLTVTALANNWLAGIPVVLTFPAALFNQLVQRVELGTAASHASTEFATAAQGAKADTALQSAPVTSVAGRTGAVTLASSDISGLGTAAGHDTGYFATAAQGAKADTALQSAAAFDAAGTAASTVSNHTQATDPHGDRAYCINASNISTGTLADARIASALTGKTVNGLTLASLATGFSLAGGTAAKTLTVSNTLTLSGTDGSTLNIGAGGTLASGAFASAGITALTGDVTASGSGSQAATLATVNSNVGTFGDSTHVAQITVNAKGLVTSVSAVAVSGGGGGSVQLDFVAITADLSITATSLATAHTVVTGNSVTYDGSTQVHIEFFCPLASVYTASNVLVFELFDGTTDLGEFTQIRSGTGLLQIPVKLEAFLTPSAGAHAYKIKAYLAAGSGPGIALYFATSSGFLNGFLRISK